VAESPAAGQPQASTFTSEHLNYDAAAATLAFPMSAQTVLKALAEPRRPAILRLVRDEARSVGEIAAHFDISQQAVSQHLQVLRAAGLVEVRRDGTRRLYRVRPQGLTPLRTFLEELWDDRLDALKREAEREERSSREHDQQ